MAASAARRDGMIRAVTTKASAIAPAIAAATRRFTPARPPSANAGAMSIDRPRSWSGKRPRRTSDGATERSKSSEGKKSPGA
ncbi:MAG: hypothetical protein AUH85_14180 [Chloroflexi bacterium 13_1_40CM_4_68_4]|nr:MAG: hypothetical protein AUH85_14180 [Chloroflexi bacterium 13_1_40CM_4_68_4]